LKSILVIRSHFLASGNLPNYITVIFLEPK